MASNNRKGKKASPKKSKTPSPTPAIAAPQATATGEWPQWMNVFMTCMQIVTLVTAAAFTTFGVAYIIRSWGDRFGESLFGVWRR
jgi:hypothetical protein